MPKGLNRKLIPLLMAALVFVLIVGSSTSAFAVLEDDHKVTSTTNPGAWDTAESSWRWDWGNSRYPQLTTEVPEDQGVVTDGFYYLMNRQALTAPTESSPHITSDPAGSLMTGTFDLDGIVQEQGGTSWRQGEGVWVLHFRFFNQFRTEAATGTADVPLGFDFTNPRPVEGLTAGVTASTPTSAWTESSRRVLRWTPDFYDGLSGVGGFAVSVNGTEKAFLRNIAPSRVGGPEALWLPFYAQVWKVPLASISSAEPQRSTITIEDLPAGSNKIGVTVVDRATNRSETRYVEANIDTDTPTIAITSPTAAVVGKSAVISAEAKDAGGVHNVVFRVDGTVVATDANAPYSTTVDMTRFGSGSHQVTATVTDMMGRTATATKTVVCDVTSPSLSKVSGSPSTFYPKKRNGYRDDYIVKLNASEACVATLVFKTSKGSTFKTITTNVKAGSNTIKWNGKSGGGNFKEGAYKWTLKLTDAAGNVSATKSGKATERFYQLKKVGKNKVKLVLR